MEDENLIKAMDAFGGGLGAHGEVCGAVIGGLAAIGLRFGRSKPGNEADMRMWKYTSLFMKRFKTEVTDGKILCRDIAGVDWKDPDQVRNFREGGKRRQCQILTGRTAKITGEILARSLAER
jgi:C_GCAxxG_C_C family probable redox protein